MYVCYVFDYVYDSSFLLQQLVMEVLGVSQGNSFN